jgi:hypothetical protein
MTTRICDKCRAIKNDLEATGDSYGHYELCDKCMKEANAVVMNVHTEWLEQLPFKKRAAFNEWMGISKAPKKRSLLQRILNPL